MIIRNNTARLIGTKIGEQKVRLIPGANDVDPEVWAAMRDMRVIKTMLKAGDLEEPKTKAEAAPVVDFKKLKASDAVKLVSDTLDVDTLEGWYADEDRKKVAEAIEKQLEKVALKSKKEDDEGEGDEEEKTGDDAGDPAK